MIRRASEKPVHRPTRSAAHRHSLVSFLLALTREHFGAKRAHQSALVAAKARGVKLGNPNGARALRGKQVGNKEAVAAIKLKAQEHATNLRSILDDVRAQGITSIRKIAEELNERGILAPRGGEWQPTTVVRLLVRLRVEAS
jgi:hypothetical protein